MTGLRLHQTGRVARLERVRVGEVVGRANVEPGLEQSLRDRAVRGDSIKTMHRVMSWSRPLTILILSECGRPGLECGSGPGAQQCFNDPAARRNPHPALLPGWRGPGFRATVVCARPSHMMAPYTRESVPRYGLAVGVCGERKCGLVDFCQIAARLLQSFCSAALRMAAGFNS